MNNSDMRIVFMGTPDFAVGPLKLLVEKGFQIVCVITSPDKPAGRGKKIHQSAVKYFAQDKGLKIIQPKNLKSPEFIDELKSLRPDLQIVVAFRMLPKDVWEIPKYGTFNLHASLLPQYRGAAPINWAIINGELKSGVTTFFIDEKIDTGNIILQKMVGIDESMNAGDLHDLLMEKGATLVVDTVKLIQTGEFKAINQDVLSSRGLELKNAPKIFKEDCRINWKKNLVEIYNFIRGLSPYPAAYTELKLKDEIILFKIFKAEKFSENHNYKTGDIVSDSKGFIKVAVNGGYISIIELQQAGKSRLNVTEFLKGFKAIGDCSII